MSIFSPGNASARFGQLLSGASSAIWLATIGLFLVSPFVASGSLSSQSLLSMLPFAAVLAIVAVGQTLVIQQRGLDLSVPGMMSLGAVLVTKIPASHPGKLWLGMVLAVLLPAGAGLVSGMVVTRLFVTPLVVTLGMNALLLGFVLNLSNGTPTGAQPALNRFALDKTLQVPNTVIVACLLAITVAFVSRRTIIGHRLTAMGVNERAAKAIGVRVRTYQTLAYAMAGACYGFGGALLAGYVQTPNIFIGDQYLLPSVAAVVLGGTAMTGGLASVASSAVAALFLSQLNQLLLARGWQTSSQLLAQSLVLVGVVALREVSSRIAGSRPRLLRRVKPQSEVASPSPLITPSGSSSVDTAISL
jgi:ribose transport system permease protein